MDDSFYGVIGVLCIIGALLVDKCFDKCVDRQEGFSKKITGYKSPSPSKPTPRPRPSLLQSKYENTDYDKAVAGDLKHYKIIMSGIDPNFDKSFEIIEKPKDAEHFRNKKAQYIEGMTDTWEQQANELVLEVIQEIEEYTNENPESNRYELKENYSNSLSRIQTMFWVEMETLGFKRFNEHWLMGECVEW